MSINMRRMSLNELGADELKRRIEAARILRNIEQVELDGLFDSDGLGKSASRMERGKLPLTRARLDALVRHLRVSEDWFTSPDIDAVLRGDGVEAGHLDDIDRRLSEIEELVRDQHRETRSTLTRLTVREQAMLDQLEGWMRQQRRPSAPAGARPAGDQDRSRKARGRDS